MADGLRLKRKVRRRNANGSAAKKSVGFIANKNKQKTVLTTMKNKHLNTGEGRMLKKYEYLEFPRTQVAPLRASALSTMSRIGPTARGATIAAEAVAHRDHTRGDQKRTGRSRRTASRP